MSQVVKKRFGQNFLVDHAAADFMADLLDSNNQDTIIEIGGGAGFLTSHILKKQFNRLIVYEIDRDWIKNLIKVTNNRPDIEIKNENFLDADTDTDTDTLPATSADHLKIIGSIPYNITSPIIHKLLAMKDNPKRIILLMQKEVAEKVTASVPRANYWTYLTLGYKVQKIKDVPPSAFKPPPSVTSSIVLFQKTLGANLDFHKWSRFLHRVYKNPRKMLNKTFDKEFLKRLGIDPSQRPHDLTINDIMLIYTHS